MKNTRILIHTAKMENKTTNRAKMSNKRCIKARLQYLQGSYNCLLYTSDAADDLLCVDLGGRRIIKKKTRQNLDFDRFIQQKWKTKLQTEQKCPLDGA